MQLGNYCSRFQNLTAVVIGVNLLDTNVDLVFRTDVVDSRAGDRRREWPRQGDLQTAGS